MRHNKTYRQRLTKRLRLKRKTKIKAITSLLAVLILTGSFYLFIYSFEQTIKSTPVLASEEVVEQVNDDDLTIPEHICLATNGENCDVIYNLCMKESGCQRFAVNKNTNGTYDHSYLQINDVHIIGRPASRGKGTITMDCVHDLYCVSRWANEQIKKGNGHIWVAWKNI